MSVARVAEPGRCEVASTLGLEGKIAVVTGGTRGLGLAIARRLCACGCHVYLNYAHSEQAAQQALEQLAGLKGTARLLREDVSVPGAAARLVEEVSARHGRLDVFVHNAATCHPMPAVQPHAGAFWDDVRLTLNPLLQAGPRLADAMGRHGGTVIAVSSGGAGATVPRFVSLGAAKSALESLVRYLAVELAPRGIAVNAVSTAKLDKQADRNGSGRVTATVARSSAGRLTVPADVADVVALLCTEEAAWIHGQVITVDGGSSCRA
jgi:enoyl-[acyl-carrier protein] reductase III